MVAAGVIRSHPLNEIQYINKRPIRVRVSAQGKVAKANVIVGCDVAGGYTGEESLFVPRSKTIGEYMICTHFWTELDVIHNFERQSVIPEQNMHPQETNQTEVTKCAVERTNAKLSLNFPVHSG